jgi:hypothetical protein
MHSTIQISFTDHEESNEVRELMSQIRALSFLLYNRGYCDYKNIYQPLLKISDELDKKLRRLIRSSGFMNIKEIDKDGKEIDIVELLEKEAEERRK